jgi:hypothetical protein
MTDSNFVIATCEKCKNPITYKTQKNTIEYKYCSIIKKNLCHKCKKQNNNLYFSFNDISNKKSKF